MIHKYLWFNPQEFEESGNMTDKSDIIEIEGTDIELGSDMVVAAGPVSKALSKTTDIEFQLSCCAL